MQVLICFDKFKDSMAAHEAGRIVEQVLRKKYRDWDIDTVALADGLATAAMVLGPEKALKALNSLPDCEGYLIGKDLKQYQTTKFLS